MDMHIYTLPQEELVVLRDTLVAASPGLDTDSKPFSRYHTIPYHPLPNHSIPYPYGMEWLVMGWYGFITILWHSLVW